MRDRDPTTALIFASTFERLERAAARRGLTRDHEAGAALAACAADQESLAPVDAAWSPRLEAAAARLGLGAAGTRVVGALVALALHPNLALAARLVEADAAWPSAALALELAGLGLLDDATTQLLRPTGPLLYHGVVSLSGEGPVLQRSVRVHDRLVRYVRGDSAPPAMLAATRRRPPAIHPEGADELVAALLADQPLVWVHEVLGGTGATVAAAACRSLGLEPLVIDVGSRAPGVPVAELVRAASLEAAVVGAVLVLSGAGGDSAAVAAACWGVPVPVIVVATCGWDAHWSERLPPVITCGRLPREARRQLWRRELALDGAGSDAPVSDDSTARDEELLDRVVGLQMSPEEIVAVAAHARTLARLADQERPDGALLRQAARRLGNHGTTSVGTRAVTMDDLVLPDLTRREIARLISWADHRDDVTALGALHGTGGKANGITALFSGGPGTGKTLAAHVVAESLGMELYQVDLTTVVDKYVGETEKNLERIFREASAMHAVLFFDEADALFGARSGVSDSKDRYANMEVAYLLQRMEKLDGVTILATNLKGNLDPAFARRLHFMINFPDPDVPTRERLWAQHLRPVVVQDEADPLDVGFLAREIEMTGGEIRNVVLAATYDAVGEGVPLGMRHLGVAVLRELSKLGRRPREVVTARFAPPPG